jgi:NAD(P)H-dependent flavin oxidoreductase YrpB (nitropropane dioxygenase family)
MVITTRVTEMLGIKHPVIQGGMHFVGYAGLAAAVSNAGGLGIITALTQATPEDLRKEIRKCKALTNKPFGVNITLLPVVSGRVLQLLRSGCAAGLTHVKLADALPPSLQTTQLQLVHSSQSRHTSTHACVLRQTANPDYTGYCKVIIEEGIKIVETAGRNPGEYIKVRVAALHRAASEASRPAFLLLLQCQRARFSCFTRAQAWWLSR